MNLMTKNKITLYIPMQLPFKTLLVTHQVDENTLKSQKTEKEKEIL